MSVSVIDFSRSVLSKVCLSVLLCLPLSAQSLEQSAEPEAATGFTPKPAVNAANFMAATANPYATQAAHQVLAQGGSAVDAAITAQMVLTLTEPQSSGIGGGLFMLLWDSQAQKLVSLDGRETAPATATPELFLDDKGQPLTFWDAVIGGRSVGVPSVVAALYEAHQRYGKLAWETLFTPAITLAEQGFVVSDRLAALLKQQLNPGLQRDGAAKKYFYPNDQALTAGTVLKNPELASSLKRIAKHGPSGFYQGPLATDIVNAVQQDSSAAGGLSLSDLANYQPQWREPVCVAYRAKQVCGMAPPSSGGLAIGQILALLAPYNIASLAPNSTEFLHLFSQASRLAYADRDHYVADPAFASLPTERMLQADYLSQRRALIPAQQDQGKAEAGIFMPRVGQDRTQDLPSTTHLVMADKNGNLLSLTSSIEMGFGSSIMVGGFLLNNQLTDFSRAPKVGDDLAANRVEANKRPRSSMAPTIVLDEKGQPLLAIGSPGGSRIISYVAQTTIALLDWNMALPEAMALPRVSHRNDYLALESEQPWGNRIEQLQQRGYQIKQVPLNSGVQVIMKTPSGWQGAADPRREGVASGG